jgi:hypothetical protein
MKQETIPDILPPEIKDLFAQFAREERPAARRDRRSPPESQEPAARASKADGCQQTEVSTNNPDPAVKETNAKDRESNGRFAKGNRGGCGNPFARQVAAFRACLISSVTEEDMQAIVWKLVDRARFGNLQAIKLLFSYLLGTPKPVVEPDELDLNEMHLAQQTALAEKALQEAEAAMPPTNDAAAPPDGEVGRPAESVPEAPTPPAAAPSTNGTNREPCCPTASVAPSPNGEFNAAETGKPSQQPSANRSNGAPAASGSQNRPSRNRSNGKRQQRSFGSEPPPDGQTTYAEEKQT